MQKKFYTSRHGQQTSMQVVMWLPKVFVWLSLIAFLVNYIP